MGFRIGGIHMKMEFMEQHAQFLQEKTSLIFFKWKIKLGASITFPLLPSTKQLVALEASGFLAGP